MREKLNSNPLYQVAAIGVLLIAAGAFLLSTMGGGGKEEAEGAATPSAESIVATVAASEGAASMASVPPVPARPLPHRVTAAFAANRTVVLLIVKRGGIDDAMTVLASLPVGFVRGVSLFVVPADKIARYAAITQGVKVERVPALVVVGPKRLDHGIPTASVSYGFQSPESIVQAVVDAGYRGPTLDYHP
jgi:hypothetical protein